MEILGGLDDSLRAMGFAQQVLAFLFVAGYSLALGGLPEPKGRRRAWCFSAAMAVGFVVMTRPWVHGALLVAFSVAALGLFIAVVWILSGVLSLPQRRFALDGSIDGAGVTPAVGTEAAAPRGGMAAEAAEAPADFPAMESVALHSEGPPPSAAQAPAGHAAALPSSAGHAPAAHLPVAMSHPARAANDVSRALLEL